MEPEAVGRAPGLVQPARLRGTSSRSPVGPSPPPERAKWSCWQAFTKRNLTLTGKIFIDGTELGDVLATSGLPFLQGIETPQENSSGLLSSCGQAATLTFYAELLDREPPQPPQPLPAGNGAGKPWVKNLTEAEFRYAAR